MKKRILLVLVAALLAAATISCFAGCDPKATAPAFVRAQGPILLDSHGKPFGLVGTNLGGWLVQESWLVPTDVGGEYGHIDMLVELANKFGKQKADELIATYEDNWVTEADFKFIKDLGMNCVRLPFSYMTLCDAVRFNDETELFERTPFEELSLRDDAFARIDWALEMCKKYGLYLILDMHGAVGSQNGNDHSGDIAFHDEGGLLWRQDATGEICRQKTKELWVAVASRYKDETAVAFYDLLNEPGTKDANGNQKTARQTWDYFDELLDAIRLVDPNHAVCMESCWEAGDLPSPSEYGWQNVIYQYHHYNWVGDRIVDANSFYYGLKRATLSLVDVPIFIGEFNVWGDCQRKYGDRTQTDEDAWAGVVELYCGLGWHFTTWNFKHAATNSTWGLLNLASDLRQANFRTDSAEEIAEAWRAGNSSNYRANSSLIDCVKPNLSPFNAERAETDRDFRIL